MGTKRAIINQMKKNRKEKGDNKQKKKKRDERAINLTTVS
jgi:hypothetical protein